MEYNLGEIEIIKDLRSVWKNEAKDFTTWLSQIDNLNLLSKAIGIDIVLEERESSVGDFSVDIYAKEDSTGRKIIIENQLEDTNHDHLGKIITYASGKDAELIIWIVKRARDEHKQAIEWLNQHTDDNIGFFLIEIELWKIDDSRLAPKFNVVERPNDWAKTIKVLEGLSQTDKLKLEFWQQFNERASANAPFTKEFSLRKAQPAHWYDLSIGSSACHVSLTVNTQKKQIGAELYFSSDKDRFFQLKENNDEITKIIGSEVDWHEASQDCRMIVYRKRSDIKQKSEWDIYFDWLIDMSIRLKKVFKEFDD